jgi:hypothetical protein
MEEHGLVYHFLNNVLFGRSPPSSVYNKNQDTAFWAARPFILTQKAKGRPPEIGTIGKGMSRDLE